MKDKKKSIILTGIGIFILLLVIIGATYAYLEADLGRGAEVDINAATGTTDSLSFDAGNPIRIHATLENFAEGMENLKGSTTATATLKANNTTNEANSKYNIFFIIDDNDFVYSTEDGQTELLLKVTDPNGNEVTNITGLKRVENGFDITTRTGGFLVRSDYEIETTSTTAQTWNIEVALINLDSEQNINMGKTFHGRFYITTEQLNTYELAKINAIEAETTYNKIDANLNYTVGTSEVEKYYYAIEEDISNVALLGYGNGILRTGSLAAKELNYIESDEPTHTFENLKPNTSYKVYSYAKDKQGINSNVYETSITTDEYELPKVTGLTHTSELYKITVTATSEAGSNEVSKYYFSKDNGATWSEGQASPTYVFDNLLDTTTYNIKVKVSDKEDKYSTEYYEAIATSTYINPSITTVTNTKTYNSITLTATATKGTNEISKYYFSKDNGATWTAGQASNAYTYTGLSENTTYNIKVKVEDTNGRMSNPYSLNVTTNPYRVPSVTASISTTYNSITINATGTKGDGDITKYLYSRDGGSNWSESTSNSFTFNGLTHSTAFQVRVKVVDNNNRESSIYALEAVTRGVNFTLLSSFDITGETAKLTNMIKNGSFEEGSTNWDLLGTEITTSQSSHGNKALQFNYGNNYFAMSSQALDKKAPSLNHTYYGRLKFLSNNGFESTDNRFEWFYLDNDGANLVFVRKSLKATSWTLMSNMGAIQDQTYLTQDWIIRNFQVNANSYSYADELMMIDVTESYGNNIPSKEFLDSLMYFDGTKSIKTVNGSNASFNVNGLQSGNYKIECDGGNATVNGTGITINSTSNKENVVCKIEEVTFASTIKSLYTTQGANGLYHHDNTLANGAGDNSYRYAGANPNNYVCFGATIATCPHDNLYRIIGVFGDQVKLIKADYAMQNLLGVNGAFYTTEDKSGYDTYRGNHPVIASYLWNNHNGESSTNVWSSSNLNTINLNTNYLNIIGSPWSRLINTTAWQVGGMSSHNALSTNARTAFNYEVGANKAGTIYNSKIGLMYLSDYYYAANPTFWTYVGYNSSNAALDYRAAINNNWLYLGFWDWTISRNSDNSIGVLDAARYGEGAAAENPHSYHAAIRPTFYLQKDILIQSGNGTKENPYRIAVPTQVPTINNLSSSNSSNAITVYYQGYGGNNSISHYLVSCNGGASFNVSYSTEYTCSNLNANTTYDISVKAVDVAGVQSTAANIRTTTSSVPPGVGFYLLGKGCDSFEIEAQVTLGTHAISHYLYSINGGNTWMVVPTSATVNRQFFSGLNINYDYLVLVKVVDIMGVESIPAGMWIRTLDYC